MPRSSTDALSGAVVVGMIPAYLFALLGQRYLVRGLTMGGLKG